MDFCISRAHKYICGVIELCKKARCWKSDIDALYEWLLKEVCVSWANIDSQSLLILRQIYYLDCPRRVLSGITVDLCCALDVERGAVPDSYIAPGTHG